MESVVQERLGSVRDVEDVFAFTRGDIQSGNGSDQEEAEDNGKLTANHESRKVLSVALEEKVAGLLSEEGSSTLVGRKLGDPHLLLSRNPHFAVFDSAKLHRSPAASLGLCC